MPLQTEKRRDYSGGVVKSVGLGYKEFCVQILAYHS